MTNNDIKLGKKLNEIPFDKLKPSLPIAKSDVKNGVEIIADDRGEIVLTNTFTTPGIPTTLGIVDHHIIHQQILIKVSTEDDRLFLIDYNHPTRWHFCEKLS